MPLLDLPGPDFLVTWLAGWAAIAIAVFVVRAIVARANARDIPDDVAATLHPTEIAYLVGGIDHAIEAAVAGLHHRGAITAPDDVGELHATGDTGEVARPDGVFRGAIDRAELSRVEAHVMERLPATVRVLCTKTDALEVVLRRTLEERGLLLERRDRATHIVRAPAYLWMLAGISKLFIGLARGKPVMFLLALLAAGTYAVYRIRAPRLTATGHTLVGELKHRYAALESTASTAPQQLDATDLMLAYGVFGYAILPAALMTMMPSYHAALAATVSASSVTSCGSSCGSSCSSCGGGCGGGCGGCS